jgi:hypothetical protein
MGRGRTKKKAHTVETEEPVDFTAVCDTDLRKRAKGRHPEGAAALYLEPTLNRGGAEGSKTRFRD